MPKPEDKDKDKQHKPTPAERAVRVLCDCRGAALAAAQRFVACLSEDEVAALAKVSLAIEHPQRPGVSLGDVLAKILEEIAVRRAILELDPTHRAVCNELNPAFQGAPEPAVSPENPPG